MIDRKGAGLRVRSLQPVNQISFLITLDVHGHNFSLQCYDIQFILINEKNDLDGLASKGFAISYIIHLYTLFCILSMIVIYYVQLHGLLINKLIVYCPHTVIVFGHLLCVCMCVHECVRACVCECVNARVCV